MLKSYYLTFNLIVTIFSIFGLVSAGNTEPTISTKKTYYQVTGNTVNEIRKSLYNNTTIIEKGQKYHAYTKWYVKWSFNWQKSPNSCQISSVKTKVDVQYTLPKLITYSSLSPSIKGKWSKYYQALINHEQGHKNFGVNAAREIEKSISNMEKRDNCHQLEKDANHIGQKIIKKYVQQEKKYDQVTHHSISQGAVFP